MPLPPITLELLVKSGACEPSRDVFRSLFGDGPAPLTYATAEKVASLFLWRSAALRLLPLPACQAYMVRGAVIWHEYVSVTNRKREEFGTHATFKEYMLKLEDAKRNCDVALARLFVDIYREHP